MKVTAASMPQIKNFAVFSDGVEVHAIEADTSDGNNYAVITLYSKDGKVLFDEKGDVRTAKIAGGVAIVPNSLRKVYSPLEPIRELILRELSRYSLFELILVWKEARSQMKQVKSKRRLIDSLQKESEGMEK